MLAKNSMRELDRGQAVERPATVVCAVELTAAELSTGKFCKPLAPASASPMSLGVTPLAGSAGPAGNRSMPRRPLLETLFCVSVMPLEAASTAMPEPLMPDTLLPLTVTPLEPRIQMPPSLPCAPSFVIVLLAIRLVPVTEATSTAAAPPVRRCVPLTVLPVKVMLAPDSLTPSSPLPLIRLLVIWLPVLERVGEADAVAVVVDQPVGRDQVVVGRTDDDDGTDCAGGRLVVVRQQL